MQAKTWIRGPVGIDAARRVTRTGLHTVLVMVPTMTAGTRLLDLAALLDGDHRVQIVFTAPHAEDTWHGLDAFTSQSDGVVLPWQQAIHHEWDLVLSASHRHLERISGKILLLPHGASTLMSRLHSRKAGTPTTPTTGVDRELLTYRGRVIPSAIGLANEEELSALRESCAEAAPAAFVGGDICLDQLLVSSSRRGQYRAALGVPAGAELITISSTWSPDSTFGRHPEIYERITGELAGTRHRVCAVLHPNVWAVHGRRQIRSWLASAINQGLVVIPPEQGWQATMIASDIVVGDHGSTTVYAAALGTRVGLAAFPAAKIRRGSVADVVARHASILDHGTAIRQQLDRIPPFGHTSTLLPLISTRVGASTREFQTAMYRLMALTEPPRPAALRPFPLPQPFPW